MTDWAATTDWPVDPGHREAIETLLMMAEDEHRCGQARQVFNLLAGAERIVGPLPERYRRLREVSASSALRRFI